VFVWTQSQPGATFAFRSNFNPANLSKRYTIAGKIDDENVIATIIDSRNYVYTVGSIEFSDVKSKKKNVYLAKSNSKGKVLFFADFGGSGDEYGTAIDVDKDGNIYITGMTTSTDFPFTNSALQTRQAGIADAFVVKINPNLPGPESIVYATYLGGSASDMGLGIAVDKNGAAYITGRTNSQDFPTTSGSAQPSTRGGGEAFIAKLTPDGSRLEYSTFLGGSGSEYAYGIDLDENGNAYIAGTTDSLDFPATLNAFQPRLAGKADAFAACLSATGNQLLYSSFLGGSGFDDAFEIEVEGVYKFHIKGMTDEGFPPNSSLRIEQDVNGNFTAAFVFESPVLIGKNRH
jgi:hypothetical protein